ncbi:MAG TPA: DUF4245 domain-containing protein [Dermatophilaceae bacterium]|nr:DUF4245 domain-containing protein [Dermatophilaceae bacterium]
MSQTPQRSRYSMGSAANMVRSMLVVGGLVLLLIVLVPRVTSVSGPPVDVAATAATVARDSGRTVLVATGLPEGWTETSARYVRSTDGLMTWHAGYRTPEDTYVAVEQTVDATQQWVDAQTNRARRVGEVTAGGRTWVTYARDGKVQNSMLDRRTGAGEATTLVTGTADFDVMTDFVGYLREVRPA